jgi:hypothetical protein
MRLSNKHLLLRKSLVYFISTTRSTLHFTGPNNSCSLIKKKVYVRKKFRISEDAGLAFPSCGLGRAVVDRWGPRTNRGRQKVAEIGEKPVQVRNGERNCGYLRVPSCLAGAWGAGLKNRPALSLTTYTVTSVSRVRWGWGQTSHPTWPALIIRSSPAWAGHRETPSRSLRLHATC